MLSIVLDGKFPPKIPIPEKPKTNGFRLLFRNLISKEEELRQKLKNKENLRLKKG